MKIGPSMIATELSLRAYEGEDQAKYPATRDQKLFAFLQYSKSSVILQFQISIRALVKLKLK